jgi:hypothetical protein
MISVKEYSKQLVIAALLCHSFVQAQTFETHDPRRIISLGCHVGDGVCSVTLEGAVFVRNATNCPVLSNEVRWDNADKEGRRAYSSLMVAMLAGKKVQLTVSGCTLQKFPKLAYYFVGAN